MSGLNGIADRQSLKYSHYQKHCLLAGSVEEFTQLSACLGQLDFGFFPNLLQIVHLLLYLLISCLVVFQKCDKLIDSPFAVGRSTETDVGKRFIWLAVFAPFENVRPMVVAAGEHFAV